MMEPAKYWKWGALCLVLPRFGLSLLFQQSSCVPFLSTAHQLLSFPVLLAPRSSVFLWIHVRISQFLVRCISPLWWKSSGFVPSSLIAGCCTFSRAGHSSSTSVEPCGMGPCSTALSPHSSWTLRPGCWNLYSFQPDLHQAQFSTFARYYSSLPLLKVAFLIFKEMLLLG